MVSAYDLDRQCPADSLGAVLDRPRVGGNLRHHRRVCVGVAALAALLLTAYPTSARDLNPSAGSNGVTGRGAGNASSGDSGGGVSSGSMWSALGAAIGSWISPGHGTILGGVAGALTDRGMYPGHGGAGISRGHRNPNDNDGWGDSSSK